MCGSREKKEILEQNGYQYNSDEMIFLNKEKKKAFSAEWVDDNDKNELEEKIAEENRGEFGVYFSYAISDKRLNEIKKLLS